MICDVLRRGSILFEGLVDFSKGINLLFDDVIRHYYVITDLTGDMAKRYVRTACNKGVVKALDIFVIIF